MFMAGVWHVKGRLVKAAVIGRLRLKGLLAHEPVWLTSMHGTSLEIA
jgi:hypothetical protein